MAYRPHQSLILALFGFFNYEPPSAIPSNFPALARRIEYLQTLEPGSPPDQPSYSDDAPQERDIDIRVQMRAVERALNRMDPSQREIIQAAYKPTEVDERLEKGVTPVLVGLLKFSKLQPERHMNNHRVLTAVRLELDELWRTAHRAFEKEYR